MNGRDFFSGGISESGKSPIETHCIIPGVNLDLPLELTPPILDCEPTSDANAGGTKAPALKNTSSGASNGLFISESIGSGVSNCVSVSIRNDESNFRDEPTFSGELSSSKINDFSPLRRHTYDVLDIFSCIRSGWNSFNTRKIWRLSLKVFFTTSLADLFKTTETFPLRIMKNFAPGSPWRNRSWLPGTFS
jgi:hypothetical protein